MSAQALLYSSDLMKLRTSFWNKIEKESVAFFKSRE
jgi:hypothetical protein